MAIPAYLGELPLPATREEWLALADYLSDASLEAFWEMKRLRELH